MHGTTTEETLDILLMPPMTMMSVRTVRTMPHTESGIPKEVFSAFEIEFACERLPMPNEASVANSANSHPRALPNLLFLKPRFMVYIGPPDISPFSLTVLYLIESMHSLNFVVSPKQAEIHIQTSAPGPPANIAVATPTILPVPIVAASAVMRALNGDTSPVPRVVFLDSLPRTLRRA